MLNQAEHLNNKYSISVVSVLWSTPGKLEGHRWIEPENG